MADINVSVGGVEDNSNKPSKKRKLLFLIIGVFFVVIILVASQILSNRNKTVVPPGAAFVVDGRAYSKDKINKMIDATETGSDQASREKMAKTIYDMYVTQAASQKANITPSNNELDSAKIQVIQYDKNSGEAKQYNDIVVYNKALQDSYKRYREKQVSGWVFVFNYGRPIMDFSALKPEASKPDIEKYKNDRDYAKQQADINYNKIKNGSISPEQLAKKIEEDDRVNFLNLTGNFSLIQVSDIDSQIPNYEIAKFVKGKTKKGLSPIMQGRLYAAANNKNQVDAFYYFVRLDEIKPAIKNPEKAIQKKSESMKNKYGGLN